MIAAHTDVLSVAEVAHARRSIRAFAPDPISHADIQEILQIVSLAPSAANTQPWRFVIVENPEVKSALAAAAYNQRQVSGAPAVIVLYTDMADTLGTLDEVMHPGMDEETRSRMKGQLQGMFANKSEIEREAWGAEQGNIALGYLMLAAESLGYQTSPMAGFDPEAVKTLLGLPAHVRVPAIVAIGRGVEDGFAHHRHSVDRISRFV